MKLSTLQTSTGRVIRIEADEVLDLRAHGVFVDACRLADYPDLNRIEVNLGKTRNINDSGVHLLLMLYERTRTMSLDIRLINCSAEIRRRLTTSRIGKQFHNEWPDDSVTPATSQLNVGTCLIIGLSGQS